MISVRRQDTFTKVSHFPTYQLQTSGIGIKKAMPFTLAPNYEILKGESNKIRATRRT